MEIREHDLPGVGKKFALVTDAGERLTVVIHNTGEREIYGFGRGEEFPSHAWRLSDPEARRLGAILGGAYYQPPVAESMEMVLDQLSVEWLKVGERSPLAGRTIRELAIRSRTGASVIAILRGGRAVPNPDPSARVEPGDTLLVVGDREQVGRVREMARAPAAAEP